MTTTKKTRITKKARMNRIAKNQRIARIAQKMARRKKEQVEKQARKNRLLTTYDHGKMAGIVALRTMHAKSGGNETIAKLRKGLLANDVQILRKQELNDAGHNLPINNSYTDGMDIVQEATAKILELLPNQSHDEVYKMKDEVFGKALRHVHNYVYNQSRKVRTKQVYISDMVTNDAGEVLDAGYVRVTKHYDIDTLEDYNTYEYMHETLKPYLTQAQRDILHKRLQGYSVVETAKKIGVSHQAVSKQLQRIQKIVVKLFPNITIPQKVNEHHKELKTSAKQAQSKITPIKHTAEELVKINAVKAARKAAAAEKATAAAEKAAAAAAAKKQSMEIWKEGIKAYEFARIYSAIIEQNITR